MKDHPKVTIEDENTVFKMSGKVVITSNILLDTVG